MTKAGFHPRDSCQPGRKLSTIMTVWMLAMRKMHFISCSFPSLGIYGWGIIQGKASQGISGRWWSWWGHNFGTMAVMVGTKRWSRCVSVLRQWTKKYLVYMKLFYHQTEWDFSGSTRMDIAVKAPGLARVDLDDLKSQVDINLFCSLGFSLFFHFLPLNTSTLRTKGD